MVPELHITGTDIKHAAYCEYIIYIKYRLGIQETPTEYMQFGGEIEKEKHINHIKAVYKPLRTIRQPLLESLTRKLIGRPDYVLELQDHTYIPVEIKWAEPIIVKGKPRAKWDHIMQIAFYAILLEDTLSKNKPVKQGIIYYLKPRGKLVKIQLTTTLKKTALKLAERTREIVQGKREPSKPTSTTKCKECNYKKYCPYNLSNNNQ